MKVDTRDAPPIPNWYAPGLNGKTNTDSDSRSAKIPPLDTIAPSPKSFVDKSREHISEATTNLQRAKHEADKENGNPRLVREFTEGASGDIKRAKKLTEAAQPGDVFANVIAAQMAEADNAQRDLGKLCDEMENRLHRVRELQSAKELMLKYEQKTKAEESVNLDEPKTPEEEKDFALLKRLWDVCREEGVHLDDWTALTRDDFKRYSDAVDAARSDLKEVDLRKMQFDLKKLTNRASECWETVISSLVEHHRLILSSIRGIRGQ